LSVGPFESISQTVAFRRNRRHPAVLRMLGQMLGFLVGVRGPVLPRLRLTGGNSDDDAKVPLRASCGPSGRQSESALAPLPSQLAAFPRLVQTLRLPPPHPPQEV